VIPKPNRAMELTWRSRPRPLSLILFSLGSIHAHHYHAHH